jgi:superfamily II DNA or RNA helicase
MDRALSCFDIEENKIGTITDGKVNVGEAITFATVQTMSSVDLDPYKEYWDVVIVDECHKAVGTPTNLMMFYKVISQLNATIKLGLTATPKRNDGLERCMYALLGPKLYEVPESAVAANTVPINVFMKQDNSYDIDIEYICNPDGTINYNAVLETLCCCYERNKMIAETVNNINNSGYTCLVLSDRVEHLKNLRELVGEEYTRQLFANTASKKARQCRKECIQLLKEKKIRCLFATYQLAKEGLDIPSLDCVVFATPKKDPITIVQSCGRVGRKAPGKSFGTVIDIVDMAFPIFEGYAKKRKNIYKNKKYFVF